MSVLPVRAQTPTTAFGGLSASSDEPIDIESDLLTIYPDDHATFSGNVKAVQGTTTLRAREIKVNYLGAGKAEIAGDEDVANAEPDADAGEGAEQDNKDDGSEPTTPQDDASSAGNDETPKVIEDPIDIVSDWLLVNDKDKYAQFKGNVEFMQGATRLRAKELKVSYAGNDDDPSAGGQMRRGAAATEITKIEASGDVRALFMPNGSAETTSAGATPPQTTAGGASPQETVPGSDNLDRTVNTAADGSRPQSAGSDRPGVAAQAAPNDTAGAPDEERDGNEGITKIEATGEVVVTGEKNETTTSDWLVYDLPAQWVTIGGNVVLSQGQNVLKGDRLFINLETGESRFENLGTAATGRGRVRALFQPKDADDKPEKRKTGGGAAAPGQIPQ